MRPIAKVVTCLSFSGPSGSLRPVVEYSLIHAKLPWG